MEAPSKPVDQEHETIRQYVAELIGIESSLEAAISAWHAAFAVDEATPGFPIQPPRAGSQLAAAGVQGGDRLIAVDGQAVHSIGDIQTAIRKRPIGDTVGLLVQHGSDAPYEIHVKHVGDYQ